MIINTDTLTWEQHLSVVGWHEANLLLTILYTIATNGFDCGFILWLLSMYQLKVDFTDGSNLEDECI